MAREKKEAKPAALYRLMAWLSPAYPVGAFSYSGGIEWAVEALPRLRRFTPVPTIETTMDVDVPGLAARAGWTRSIAQSVPAARPVDHQASPTVPTIPTLPINA